MKSLICALSVLTVITGFVVFSSVYITRSCDELEELAYALPSITKGEEALECFSRYYPLLDEEWQKRNGYIRATVGHSDAEDIGSTLEEVMLRFKSDDLSGYKTARAKLISLIGEIRRAEELSWYAIE